MRRADFQLRSSICQGLKISERQTDYSVAAACMIRAYVLNCGFDDVEYFSSTILSAFDPKVRAYKPKIAPHVSNLKRVII